MIKHKIPTVDSLVNNFVSLKNEYLLIYYLYIKIYELFMNNHEKWQQTGPPLARGHAHVCPVIRWIN